MLTLSPAKINLGLHIGARLESGYHQISSILYPIPFYDLVEVIPHKSLGLVNYGINCRCSVQQNICIKAWELLHEKYKIPKVKIILYKHIPPGSGLGGGSSNAVSTLKLLDQLFDLRIDEKTFYELASILGSDCPFFIRSKPAKVSGRGTESEPVSLDLSGHWITLVLPPFPANTHEMYQNFDRLFPAPTKEIGLKPDPDKSHWQQQLKNDFEPVIFDLYPETAMIKKKLYEAGAYYASLNGSGSGFYALSEQPIFPDVPASYKVIQKKFT